MSTISQFRNARYYNGRGRTEVKLGPWRRGMVTSTITMATDSLLRCWNYIIKQDGTLVSRPPINSDASAVMTNSSILGPGAAQTDRTHKVIGTYRTITNGVSISYPLITVKDNVTPATTVIGRVARTGTPTNSAKVAWTAFGTAIDLVRYLYYNGVHYLFSTTKLYSSSDIFASTAMTEIAAFDAVATGNVINAHFIHDRFVAVTDTGGVYWSKATDPSVWASPDGGLIRLPNGVIVGSVVFQDSIYLFTTEGLYRFSFQTDPLVDGILERLNAAYIGGGLVLHNDLYYYDSLGVYQWLNGQVVEVTEPIRDFYRGLNRPASISLLDKYIIVGPFSSRNWANAVQGAFSLVFDTELRVWTMWGCTNYQGTFAGGNLSAASLPQGEIAYAQYDNGGGTVLGYWVWTGPAVDTSATAVWSMVDSLESNSGDGNGADMGLQSITTSPIGHYLVTPVIDLGSRQIFKRLISLILDAHVGGLSTHFTGYAGIDGVSNEAFPSINPPAIHADFEQDILDNGRVSLSSPSDGLSGKSFRFKQLYYFYDSRYLSTMDTFAVELNDVRSISMKVSMSREVTT